MKPEIYISYISNFKTSFKFMAKACYSTDAYNLLVAVKHNKYTSWLQDVLYKIQQDDMFRST